MKDNGWGKEPFDLRLTALRLVRKLPAILLITALGTILLGGGYYLKNVTFRQRTYVATATFLVDYVNDNWFEENAFISDYTWNEWMKTDEFQGYVLRHLQGAAPSRKLDDALSASVAYDLRIVTISSASGNPEEANRLNDAVRKAMTEDFAGGIRDVASVRETDANEAAESLKTVKPVRAAVLAAVVSCFAGTVFFLLKELVFEQIWLPASLTNRYGLKSVGVYGTDACEENLAHFFRGTKKAAVCPVGEDLDCAGIAKALGKGKSGNSVEWTAVPSPTLAPEVAGTLRGMDGILLVVRAGEDVKRLEMTLDFLTGQDCEVTAALLWEEDAWLLRNYYRWNFRK